MATYKIVFVLSWNSDESGIEGIDDFDEDELEHLEEELQDALEMGAREIFEGGDVMVDMVERHNLSKVCQGKGTMHGVKVVCEAL